MQASDVKYFDGAEGFLVITSGSSANGKGILALTNISLDYSVENEEVLTFDQNRSKSYSTTFDTWNISCEGFFTTLTAEGTHPASGETYFVGATNGADILETVKLKRNDMKIIMKLGTNNYQKGSVILSSYNVSGTAGESMKFSLELQGTGPLTKSTS